MIDEEIAIMTETNAIMCAIKRLSDNYFPSTVDTIGDQTGEGQIQTFEGLLELLKLGAIEYLGSGRYRIK